MKSNTSGKEYRKYFWSFAESLYSSTYSAVLANLAADFFLEIYKSSILSNLTDSKPEASECKFVGKFYGELIGEIYCPEQSISTTLTAAVDSAINSTWQVFPYVPMAMFITVNGLVLYKTMQTLKRFSPILEALSEEDEEETTQLKYLLMPKNSTISIK